MADFINELNDLNASLNEVLSSEQKTAFANSINTLKQSGLETHSLPVGDQFPDFRLMNTRNIWVDSKELFATGKIILVFFRGSWCPYCNLHLKALQRHLAELTADKKTTLIAITPQITALNTIVHQEHALNFDILHDKDNELAKKLGITFELSAEILHHYTDLGIDVKSFNQTTETTLPVPAIYLINQQSSVEYHVVNSDYTQRLDPKTFIPHL